MGCRAQALLRRRAEGHKGPVRSVCEDLLGGRLSPPPPAPPPAPPMPPFPPLPPQPPPAAPKRRAARMLQ